MLLLKAMLQYKYRLLNNKSSSSVKTRVERSKKILLNECKRATEIYNKYVRILPELILHCSSVARVETVLASSSLSKI